MLARVRSVASVGLQSVPVIVEVDVASRGFPSFNVVGLPSKAIDEAKERVRTAIINSGCDFPLKKITINLAPADIPKNGSAFDLPIALGILIASGQIILNREDEEALYYGELGLDGSLGHSRGVLLVAIYAKEAGIKQIFVPLLSANEAAVVDKVATHGVRNICELIRHIRGEAKIRKLESIEITGLIDECEEEVDFSEIVGQESAKRAMVIAAAGGHNALMTGPPGSGKSMLSKALPGILPRMTESESLEVSRIYSVAGLMGEGEAIVRRRPFRSPHHSTSLAGLVGGGGKPQPGEVSLAHLGVLFLDEMAEFPRFILESLRQPMEDARVVISRAGGRVEYPANFMLVGAVNPCPCGFWGHPTRECKCGERQRENYRRRISGPIMDRIDLHVEVGAVEVEKLGGGENNIQIKGKRYTQSSKELRWLVEKARQVQIKRFKSLNIHNNAEMKNKQVREFCILDSETERLLRMAVAKFDLSARGYFRLIKVARTIADLEESETIKVNHMAEAMEFRQRID